MPSGAVLGDPSSPQRAKALLIIQGLLGMQGERGELKATATHQPLAPLLHPGLFLSEIWCPAPGCAPGSQPRSCLQGVSPTGFFFLQEFFPSSQAQQRRPRTCVKGRGALSAGTELLCAHSPAWAGRGSPPPGCSLRRGGAHVPPHSPVSPHREAKRSHPGHFWAGVCPGRRFWRGRAPAWCLPKLRGSPGSVSILQLNKAGLCLTIP